MSYGTTLRLSVPAKRQYIEGVTPDPGGALSLAMRILRDGSGFSTRAYRFGSHRHTRNALDRENTVAFADTSSQAASVYALILVLLVPFIVLGMVVGLFWWEERILPSAERSLTAALMQSIPDFPSAELPSAEGAERFAAAGNGVSALSLMGAAEPAERSTATAPSAADARLIAHPAASGPARFAHGWPGARRVRSSELSGARRRLSRPPHNGRRDHH